MERFCFSNVPLEPAALARSLADPACGGFAAFEGWVRDHNEGQPVARLEYEAYAELAVREGERIVEEAIRHFDVARALCVHRTGSLGIGDLAVWVGVSAAHRDEAFRACRYIIDVVKHRLPIWKKEHYRSGDSGWVNCERCAAPTAHECEAHGHHEHTQVPRPDYSRQTILAGVGERGQRRLKAASVLVVGAGGLGVPVLSYLAGAGVGTLGIVDGDRLEPSNLHRQTMYSMADCGAPKARLAAARVQALNPEVRTEVIVERLTTANADAIAARYELIVDCTDNFSTKFLLNDVAQRHGRILVLASVYQYEGQLQVVRGERCGACLRCVWPEATRDGLVGNCVQAGVLGPVPGVFGSLQALEALKILLDLPGQLRDELLILDLTTFATSRVRAQRNDRCTAGPCVRAAVMQDVSAAAVAPLEVEFDSLDTALEAGYAIVDLREPAEIAAQPAPVPVRRLPLAELSRDPSALDPASAALLVCARGSRSLAATQELRSRGYANVKSLRGGLLGLLARS